MSELTDIRVVKGLLKKHGLTLKKALGQNFLIDPDVPPSIAAGSGITPEMGVLEIGPGLGVLTRELAAIAGKVVAVELDRGLEKIHRETLSDLPNTKVIFGDIMETDLASLLEEEFSGMEVAVCANLPYYITTPVIMKLLESKLPFCSITVMVQKEVAQRLAASPGGKEYGAVTLAVQYRSKVKQLLQVPAASFLPPPKVDSTVIKLEMLDKPPVQVSDEAFLFRIIRASFAQRRKTLANGLQNGLGPRFSKEDIQQVLRDCQIADNIRGEALSLEKFAQICEKLVEIK